MKRYDSDTTEADIDDFVKTLGCSRIKHKEIVKCYSIFLKNEYFNFLKNNDNNWCEIELNCLTEGVRMCGKDFDKVLQCYSAVFGPKGRTSSDLQNKWEELVRATKTKQP